MAKPFTSMNESGVAVKKIMDFYQITDPKKLIVISDDINTLPGSLAIQGRMGAEKLPRPLRCPLHLCDCVVTKRQLDFFVFRWRRSEEFGWTKRSREHCHGPGHDQLYSFQTRRR